MIKNLNDLALNERRRGVLEAISSTMDLLNTPLIINDNISFDEEKRRILIEDKEFILPSTGRILIAAVGKCAQQASEQLLNIFGDNIKDGVAIDIIDKAQDSLGPIKYFKGSHPYPSDDNIVASKKLIELLESANSDDIVIGVISGGGSTLLVQPTGDFSAAEEEKWLKTLFKKGANIKEINTLRKHLSIARGGHWATYSKAPLIGLIFSDVIGDDLSFISSGPTVRDETTIDDARKIIKHYALDGVMDNYLQETPKDKELFSKVNNILLLSNDSATKILADKLKEIGLKTIIKTNILQGEARKVAEKITKELKDIPANTALIYGGETTVNIIGQGQGGRNQELVLAALSNLNKDELLLSIASDGFDNTPAAGAIADEITMSLIKESNLSSTDYLENNDSYTFFNKLKQNIITGPTGVNVADLVVGIKF